MSLLDQQIEKGKIATYFKNKSNKFLKNQHARKIRRKMKQSIDYVPQYNRFKGGWEF